MPKKEKPELTQYSFPEDFLWGASTAGHQVDGGSYDQWTVWELDNATDMAKSAADRLRWMPAWLEIKEEAEDPDNYVSGKAIDHWHRYKEDFTFLKKLNLNSFRFGIEWSRVEPDQGVWDKSAFDHYHNYIAEMKSQGIEPVLNLWHWTNPVWFEEMGGFSKRKNIAHFERYVDKVAQEFGDQVRYIITINEPNVYILYSEMNGGVSVPPEQSIFRRVYTYFWLIRAHKRAYTILKSYNSNLWISTASQMAYNVPKVNTWANRMTANIINYIYNCFFYDRIKNHIDFVGFNYYFTNYYSWRSLFNGLKPENPPTPTNDMGWYMEPGSIGEIAIKVWMRYRKPIMITENGVADRDDKHRQWWIEETMHALSTARKAGADVFGYMHWSLLDNFEWHNGWWPKFGLVKVDRERGMKRLVRPSAVWWSKVLKSIKHDN